MARSPSGLLRTSISEISESPEGRVAAGIVSTGREDGDVRLVLEQSLEVDGDGSKQSHTQFPEALLGNAAVKTDTHANGR